MSPAIDRSPPVVKGLHKPCAKCPWLAKFKGEDDYLRPGRRAEIIQSTMTGGGFPCHNTVNYDNEHDGEVTLDGTESPCVGFDLVMVRSGHMTQMQRIRERIGMLDVELLKADNHDTVTWGWSEAVYELEDLESGDEIETCHVSGDDCDAPAGYMIGESVVHGTDEAEYVCSECGEPVCFACSIEDLHVLSGGGRLCDYCAEEGGE